MFYDFVPLQAECLELHNLVYVLLVGCRVKTSKASTFKAGFQEVRWISRGQLHLQINLEKQRPVSWFGCLLQFIKLLQS